MPGLRAAVALLLVGLLAAAPAGCSSTPPETGVLPVDASAYSDAFDVAADVLRDSGYSIEWMDRREGVIESTPVVGATLLDPWRWNGLPDDLGRNTIEPRRRRVRFEFSPVRPGAAALPEAVEPPDLLALETPPRNLTRATAPLELRASVIIEHRSLVGERPDTWSRRASSRARHLDPVTDRRLPVADWVAATRDPVQEAAFLERIAARLSSASSPEAP